MFTLRTLLGQAMHRRKGGSYFGERHLRAPAQHLVNVRAQCLLIDRGLHEQRGQVEDRFT